MISFKEVKKYCIYNMIGSLIIAALVAVVAVLSGGAFKDVLGKVISTLFALIVHSLISLGFIWNNEKQDTFHRFGFFSNTLFILIIISFIVSIFGIWDIFSGETVAKVYFFFFVIAFASLHGNILAKALNKNSVIDKVIFANYFFMIILVLMIAPAIFVENSIRVLGEMFFRIMAAVAIIDSTMSILTIIFYKLYLNAHPKEVSTLHDVSGTGKSQKKKLSVWVWVLIWLLILQFGLPILILILGVFGSIIF